MLADLVGRTEDSLSKIERGERDIRRLDVLAELARALRVTLGALWRKERGYPLSAAMLV